MEILNVFIIKEGEEKELIEEEIKEEIKKEEEVEAEVEVGVGELVKVVNRVKEDKKKKIIHYNKYINKI
jgi:hypothetical protein